MTMGFGTNLFGHSPSFVTAALEEQLKRGIEVGPQTLAAGKVAALLCELSGTERAAFTNTGSEAVLAAVRLARTVTGRTRIATCGGFHGINDEVLVRGVTANGQRRSLPVAPGIPDHIVRDVLVIDYGTAEGLELLRAHAHELACILIEPVQSRRPDLQPREFLHAVREITAQAGCALVFDEIINGFRCHLGGAQAYFGVRADMVTYGKIIGGGLPIGAVCGKANTSTRSTAACGNTAMGHSGSRRDFLRGNVHPASAHDGRVLGRVDPSQTGRRGAATPPQRARRSGGRGDERFLPA